MKPCSRTWTRRKCNIRYYRKGLAPLETSPFFVFLGIPFVLLFKVRLDFLLSLLYFGLYLLAAFLDIGLCFPDV